MKKQNLVHLVHIQNADWLNKKVLFVLGSFSE